MKTQDIIKELYGAIPIICRPIDAYGRILQPTYQQFKNAAKCIAEKFNTSFDDVMHALYVYNCRQ